LLVHLLNETHLHLVKLEFCWHGEAGTFRAAFINFQWKSSPKVHRSISESFETQLTLLRVWNLECNAQNSSICRPFQILSNEFFSKRFHLHFKVFYFAINELMHSKIHLKVGWIHSRECNFVIGLNKPNGIWRNAQTSLRGKNVNSISRANSTTVAFIQFVIVHHK
jgi:hypothetical protein